ncbi:MAG: thiamine-phosphate kinase [Xanthomonadales bacterium]|nr:thiamine-phosphate kinase [Xanthomonadales bacterium]
MNEFALIDWIRGQAGPATSGVSLGIGDDAAVLALAPGESLVVTTDTLNSGVHFGDYDPADSVGHKALAVNLSDLAAMGAAPRWFLLSLSLPKDSDAWVKAFVGGLLGLARTMNVALVGGDTTAGKLSVTVTALGATRQGRFLSRDGARPGDWVVVSGELGDAALALQELSRGRSPDPSGVEKLRRPIPRVELGATLVGNATACIDLSDGLLADLGHIAGSSGCGAVVEADRLPGSESLRSCPVEVRRALQLTGGDDYELCFTWPEARRDELAGIESDLGLKLSVVGRMVEGRGIRCLDSDGQPLAFEKQGYSHRL